MNGRKTEALTALLGGAVVIRTVRPMRSRFVRLKPEEYAVVGIVYSAFLSVQLHNCRNYRKPEPETAAFTLVRLVSPEKALPYLGHYFLVDVAAGIEYRYSYRPYS